MYERILTFVVGILLGVVGTFAAVHRTQKPVEGPSPSQVGVQDSVDKSAIAQQFAAEKAAIIRQANETQTHYFQQVSDLQKERDALKVQVSALTTSANNEFQAMGNWQARADACEEKFKTGTIISEPRSLISLPALGGLFSLSVNANPALGDVNGTTPVFFVPAQVEVTSRIPGVTYLWMDPHNGALKGGPFAATIKP